jgi:hypothetical protein
MYAADIAFEQMNDTQRAFFLQGRALLFNIPQWVKDSIPNAEREAIETWWNNLPTYVQEQLLDALDLFSMAQADRPKL